MNVLWRDTALPAKIGPLDARAIFPLALWVFHWAWWTFYLAIICIVILYLVQRTGMSFIACIRSIRLLFVGKIRQTQTLSSRYRSRCRW